MLHSQTAPSMLQNKKNKWIKKDEINLKEKIFEIDSRRTEYFSIHVKLINDAQRYSNWAKIAYI